MSRLLPLLVLFGCPTSTSPGGAENAEGDDDAFPTTAEAAGDCKATPDRKDLSTDTAGYEPTFRMSAEVDGDDVIVHLVDVEANCCPSPDADVSRDGSTLRVEFESVTSEDVCDCTCVFDFDVRVADVPSGGWTLDVYTDGTSRGTLDVTVP